ncbi:hypothetical protein K378_03452 [Streptomyces sp. Amel2xB2]|uniref:hypothetical protein n=1 Tax=Streptomyces sp. Amel2xB2 TaxID=1305829 RepID=UPI000DBAB895|nr:hypothetical protein [Streptomyces sp. Amel2xB2]RAJ63341.1 hypothetical protein K378_03452 [Streptomyces sp. Amel2xB2]
MNGVPRRGRARTVRLLGAPLLALVLLTAVAGCADDDGRSDARRPGEQGGTADSRESGPSSPVGKQPSSSPAASASRPSQGGADAADGTDTGACADGRCEVVLSAGDVLRPRSSYGVEKFAVESVEDHVIAWTAHFAGGSVSMSSSGAQESSSSCTNGQCSGRLGRSKGTLHMNGLTLEFTSIGAGSAVAKLSPAP